MSAAGNDFGGLGIVDACQRATMLESDFVLGSEAGGLGRGKSFEQR